MPASREDRPPPATRAAAKSCLALLSLSLALLFPSAANADRTCQLRGRPVASVLVVHGGAWYGGSSASSADVCMALAALGYRARSLDYPLRTVSGSIEYALAAALDERRFGHPVYAVGTSAGGTIVEHLALRRQVDGALAVAPLSDFVDWREPWSGFWDGLGMTPALRRQWSPYHNLDGSAPLQIIHSREDEVVPYEQSVRLVRRCGAACDLVTLERGGSHVLSVVWQLPAAFRWFLSHAHRPLPRASMPREARRHADPARVPRRWLRVAARAFPRHCRPVRIRYRPLARGRWEQVNRARCTVTLASALRRRPAWVHCTAVVHAFGHLTARWSGRHSSSRRSVMYRRVRAPYGGARAGCPPG